MSRPILLAGLILAASAVEAPAGLFHRRGTPPPGPPRRIPNTHERAGWPLSLSDHAGPTNDGTYCGHYVGGGGGGLFHRGDARCRDEGTWGWDYVGHFYPRHVFSAWNHGRRRDDATGTYRTDPPFEVPNVFAVGPPKLHRRQPEPGRE